MKMMSILKPVSIVLCLLLICASVTAVIAGNIAYANAKASGSLPQRVIYKENTEDEDTEYFKTRFQNIAELREFALDVNRKVVEGGAVLLKNENNALPLDDGAKINLYGSSSVNSVIIGIGSARQ